VIVFSITLQGFFQEFYSFNKYIYNIRCAITLTTQQLLRFTCRLQVYVHKIFCSNISLNNIPSQINDSA